MNSLVFRNIFVNTVFAAFDNMNCYLFTVTLPCDVDICCLEMNGNIIRDLKMEDFHALTTHLSSHKNA